MKQYTILIVDDELINLENLIDAIHQTNKNYKVLRANSAEMALKIVTKENPDIIITDWDMPSIDGIELIKRIKNQPELADIPVIMCTGVMTTSANLKTALDAGAIDYIRKPLDILELTARVQSTIKLAESYKEIKELNATKDKFFSIIAHDLKNPFNSIMGFSELMVEGLHEMNQESMVKMALSINNSANSAYSLLENLLDWARAQTGSLEFTPERLLLKSLVLDVIGITESNCLAKNIKIINEVDKSIHIFADKNMLNTILNNLVVNAIKFTHKNGTVKICASVNDKEVQISVIDTGVGIESRKIERLFKISEKTSTLGTENEHGTGLGLILCKEFVEKHCGKISVKSELGKGSNFTITLPLNP